jgi:hypothetical protein
LVEGEKKPLARSVAGRAEPGQSGDQSAAPIGSARLMMPLICGRFENRANSLRRGPFLPASVFIFADIIVSRNEDQALYEAGPPIFAAVYIERRCTGRRYTSV